MNLTNVHDNVTNAFHENWAARKLLVTKQVLDSLPKVPIEPGWERRRDCLAPGHLNSLEELWPANNQ